MKLVNSFIRATNASYKRKDREILMKEISERGCNQLELKQKLKKGILSAQKEYDEYVNSIISLHKSSSEALNWEYLVAAPEPKLPLRKADNQLIAESACRSFKPSLIDKLLGQGKQKHKVLVARSQEAKQQDDLIYNCTLKEFKTDLVDWTKIQAVSQGVISRDPFSYEEAIEFFNPFFHVTVLGVLLNYKVMGDAIVVSMKMDAKEIVPDFVPNKVPSGKAKLANMQDAEFHILFYSFLCSCALRIARETFALLPVEHLILNVFERNSSVKEDGEGGRAILSVKFTPGQINGLDFSSEDCAALLKSFPHYLSFSASAGFEEVEPMTI